MCFKKKGQVNPGGASTAKFVKTIAIFILKTFKPRTFFTVLYVWKCMCMCASISVYINVCMCVHTLYFQKLKIMQSH